MTISEILTVLAAGAGIAMLALMAAVPLLLELPAPRRSAPEPASPEPTVRIPAQRAAGARVLAHHS